MKSLQEVMSQKQFFEKHNSHWSVSGYIQLVPTRSGDVMKEVESSFTEVSILDKRSGNSIHIPVFDDWGLREALWDFRCEAIHETHNEWADAVRAERKYDLFAAYQNALADYQYAMEVAQ
jgi:hypothetical protein